MIRRNDIYLFSSPGHLDELLFLLSFEDLIALEDFAWELMLVDVTILFFAALYL
jgi:hypothetical protein